MIKPGCLLSELRTGDNNVPSNQGKRWSDLERRQLKKQFDKIYKNTKHKRETIKRLEKEFGRGYFSILNQLEHMDSHGGKL